MVHAEPRGWIHTESRFSCSVGERCGRVTTWPVCPLSARSVWRDWPPQRDVGLRSGKSWIVNLFNLSPDSRCIFSHNTLRNTLPAPCGALPHYSHSKWIEEVRFLPDCQILSEFSLNGSRPGPESANRWHLLQTKQHTPPTTICLSDCLTHSLTPSMVYPDARDNIA